MPNNLEDKVIVADGPDTDLSPVDTASHVDASSVELKRGISRRELLRRARTVLILGAALTGPNAILKGVEIADFINDGSYEYADDPIVTRPIYLGDMSRPAEEDYTQAEVLVGDSITWGYERGHQVCVAEIVSQDVNKIMAAAGIRKPRSRDGQEQGYWGNLMYAYPGITTAEVADQVHRFATVMRTNYPGYKGPVRFEGSMGGNDALYYFSDHMNLFRIGSIISDFRGFLGKYQSQSQGILEELASLRDTVPGLQMINIASLPDIGRSSLWYMKIPFIAQIATAACKRMNRTLVDTCKEVSERTGVEINVYNMFDLPISDIHPTKRGYDKEAARREERMIGTFPDGTRTLADEAKRHKVATVQPPAFVQTITT